jgi:hypothetical protein
MHDSSPSGANERWKLKCFVSVILYKLNNKLLDKELKIFLVLFVDIRKLFEE